MDIWLGLIMGLYCLGIVFYASLEQNLIVYWVFMFSWVVANSISGVLNLLFLFLGFPVISCIGVIALLIIVRDKE